MNDKQIFTQRRKKVFDQMIPNSIAIIASASEHLKNYWTLYDYHQNSDLYYLTGFKEPESAAVLIKGKTSCEFILFNRPRDPSQEQWVGYRAGQKGAVEKFGADQSYPISELDKKIPSLLQDKTCLYYAYGYYPHFDYKINRWLNDLRSLLRKGINIPNEIHNLDHIVHEMRLIKDDSEIELMKQAAEITAQGHLKAMRACQPGMYEYELAAELSYEFQKRGAQSLAFASIVGGGKNACILHYPDNADQLKDGDLVLVDAGCEYQYYCGDVTRTFPVNGKFTPEQKAIYELVLKTQLAIIEQMKPNNTWYRGEEIAIELITEGLCQLGILQGKISELIEKQSYKKFYMHHFGHWLGIEGHDAGSYKTGNEWKILKPGMVLTVEPGIYISADMEEVDKKWRGIGVRIEDDLLITDKGNQVLTSTVPKDIEEIEKLMKK